MSYCSEDDLLSQMSAQELAKLTGDAEGIIINHDRIQFAINRAEDIINANLTGRYDAPFVGPVDPLIRLIALELAISNLYEYAYAKSSIPSPVAWRKENALKLLKDLREGVIYLRNYYAGSTAPPLIIGSRNSDCNLLGDDYKKDFGY